MLLLLELFLLLLLLLTPMLLNPVLLLLQTEGQRCTRAFQAHPPAPPAVDFHGFTLVIYSAGISACEKGEQWQRALSLLSEMWEAKLEPDVISFDGCSACQKLAL